MKSILFTGAVLVSTTAAFALPQQTKTAAPTVPTHQTSVGFPHDARAHDANAAIEWWYFNAFLKTESGKNYAVVGSFFRTGLQPDRKGHYLIYSLTDLDDKKVIADGSILDQANATLLKSYLPLMAMQRPDDTGAMKLLAALQKGVLPAPHLIAKDTASVVNKPRFSIGFAGNAFAQKTDDARTWRADLKDPAFSMSLDFRQPSRPPMRVGGTGLTGLNRPDDMYYLSLTRTEASGVLVVDDKREKVTGIGWIDRQWGRSWIIGNNGWDWFGVHLDNGEDLIVYRVKDNTTGKTLRAEATLLQADGKQRVDKDVTFTASGEWLDPISGIAFPDLFTVSLQNAGYSLTFTPVFSEQAIPTLGIGTAFWEGVVDVTGTTKDGTAITGRGYRELVGYKPKPKE